MELLTGHQIIHMWLYLAATRCESVKNQDHCSQQITNINYENVINVTSMQYYNCIHTENVFSAFISQLKIGHIRTKNIAVTYVKVSVPTEPAGAP